MKRSSVVALLAMSLCLPLAADPFPSITSAVADSVTKTLTIRGSDFGAATPRVTLNATELTVTASTPIEITAQLPPDLAPGSYLLTVSRPPSGLATSFALTLGAVGPTGPQGLRGPSGLLDLAGKSCGAGTFLTGFGSAGDLICSALVVPGATPVITSVTATPASPLVGQVTAISIAASDADGDPLTFRSEFLALPAHSQAVLLDVFTPHPRFVPDVIGTYVIAATSTDPAGHRSQPAEVDVIATPCGAAPPNVTLVAPVTGYVGRLFTIDVLVNEVANNACQLVTDSYAAKFVSVPALAQVQIIGGSTAQPSFIPNVSGSYSIDVSVTNSIGLTTESVVRVQVQ